MRGRRILLYVGVMGLTCLATITGAGSLRAESAGAREAIPADRDPQTSMISARQWIEQGNYSKALSELRPFALQPERYPRHHSDYIVVLFWSGEPEQAIRLYEEMPASLPKKEYLKRNIAKAYLDTGGYMKAASLYRSVLRSAPDDTDALQGLIRSQVAAGQVQEATESFNRFIEKSEMTLEMELIKCGLLADLEHYKDSLFAYSRLIETSGTRAERIAKQCDDHFAALDPSHRQAALDQIQSAAATGVQGGKVYHVMLLALFGQYEKAIKFYRQYGLSPVHLTPHTAYWVGWAYFKTGKTEDALTIFNHLLEQDPANLRGRTGSAYCLARSGKNSAALSMLEPLVLKIPDNLEIYYAMAYAHEQARHFKEAIDVYDKMLTLSPGNKTVERLRIRAFSDMGASTYARRIASASLPEDHALAFEVTADSAADRIRWEEPAMASHILDAIPHDAASERLDYDRIVALNRDDRHLEAVKQYESLSHKNGSAPAYVLSAVADSYLNLEQPETALKLYDAALAQNPDDFHIKLGRFYTLKELRRWKEARNLLNEIDANTHAFIGRGQNRRYNPDQLDLDIARGWFLVHENRLAEADSYFQKLLKDAPANLEIRSALAHIYLWRGWPRRSMEAFDILHTIAPEYQPPKTGRIAALNTLAFKNKAREKGEALYRKYPRKKWVQRLARQFEVEQMNANRFEISLSREEDGIVDILMRDMVSTPLSLYTRLYGFMLWRRTWNDDPDEAARTLGDDKATYFKRLGTGITHIFNSDWEASQQFSINYDDGEEFGSLSQLNWTPDDHWRVSAMVDTFSTDVAKRARAAGISSKKIWTGIGYRESEWREYTISTSRQFFSDDNDRDEATLGYEQNLFVKNDWRMRVYLDLYGTRNSQWDDPNVNYFNPKHAWGFSITHMTEQTVRDMYEKSFVHRLFLTAGNYDQYAYSSGPVGSIRYEQEYEFSDTNALLWGMSAGRNLYDGDSLDSISIDAAWTVRF